jgi:hypothetical protein
MKSLTALVLSLVAGITTFSLQNYFFPPQLHAASFAVPRSQDWRQQMIDHDPGGAFVDPALSRLTEQLGLDSNQVAQARPILQKQHARILALLVAGPPTLTREQFMADRQTIRAATHRQLDALLTPDQRELVQELYRPTAS